MRWLVGVTVLVAALVVPDGAAGAAGAAEAQPVPTTDPAATTTTVPPTFPDGSPDLQSASWVVVDAATGAVVAGHDLHTPHYPASTVKLVTALTALRLLGPNGVVGVSEAAATRPPRKISMVAGQQWPMLDTLWCLMLVSANDTAYALAETAGGTLAGFAAEMAETGRRLGLRDSTFADPAGFDHPDDTLIGPSLMSAWDLAVVGRAVLADPVLGAMAATVDYAFTGPDGVPHTLTNHNKLLTWLPGVVGVKTGYTNAAQGTFVAAADRNGRRLIGVVMGAPNGIYEPMMRLLEHGFALAPPAGAEVLPPPVDPALTLPTTTVAPPPTTAPPVTTTPTTVPATTTVAATTTTTVLPPGAGGEAAGGGAVGSGSRDDAPPVGVAVAGAAAVGLGAATVARRRAVVRRRRARRHHPALR